MNQNKSRQTNKCTKRRHIRNIYVALCLIVSLIFFASMGGTTYAVWRTGGSTVNKVSTGIVSGTITGYDDPEQTLLLSESVPKTACIQNTGNLDACVRTRVEKHWGYGRDEKGMLDVDTSINTDNIVIDYNLDDWYYNEADGYYYYKNVLAPDESTSTLFNSFMVDGERTDSSHGNMTADITVCMEMVQAQEEGLSYWGMSADKLGISYLPSEIAMENSKVTFISPKEGFKFEISDGDLFLNFKNMAPGNNRSQTIEVKNEWSSPAKISLKPEIAEQIYSDEAKLTAVEKLLKEYMSITVTDQSGTILYSGAMGDAADGEIVLGEFETGKEQTYNVNMSFDSHADNEIAALTGNVKWQFIAEGDDEIPTTEPEETTEPPTTEPEETTEPPTTEPEETETSQPSEKPEETPTSHPDIVPGAFEVTGSPNDVVKTGDTANVMIFGLIAMTSLSFLIVLILRIKKIDENS